MRKKIFLNNIIIFINKNKFIKYKYIEKKYL